MLNILSLFGLSFTGGLAASLSPCCLSMLPINLSYIGSQNFSSRKDALVKATCFVVGTATTLCLLGLSSSLAIAVFTRYRSFILLIVGMIITLMGASLLNLIYLPFSRMGGMPVIKELGPFGVGLTFGLVGSPCATPIMFSVLALSATYPKPIAVMSMGFYALGYTLLIFLCCLFMGLAKQTKKMRSLLVNRIAGVVLMGLGVFYLGNGILLTIKRFT